ncbi:MAG: cyclic nucleotide-binding domain-containing protein [Muribaculum sp.]|nr:cyclic nucleotide-binding domain-containing protein [Muribaculum sp.]
MKKTIPGISESDKELLLKLLPDECNYKPKEETLLKLLECGNTITLAKGDALIATGEFDPNLYIIIDGLLRCCFWNGDKEETEYFSTIPTVFLNYSSYNSGKESFYRYEACTESRIIKIQRQDYDRLLSESHDFTLWMLGLANNQSYYYEMKAKRDLGDAKTKYEYLTKYFPEIFNLVPLGMIASYLKITPQYLSKIRSSLR